ncbi:hypothetical protein [Candidatus Methanodesulfokora washburnensis]|jgi:hypothetical protein|uniref:Uncharacterized protein n=1 Tax=Candidatus Methanodesulfokora washburnensis TaxID=2478471 RepID=A0A3R9RP12_9CREN|nr:hypothetical protein [Candidatus Methanodesulfokores washburnensis]RSN74940.1 hypothetical protein D6D85_07300 [Candidatus Methanodesulfokores washburnensis]
MKKKIIFITILLFVIVAALVSAIEIRYEPDILILSQNIYPKNAEWGAIFGLATDEEGKVVGSYVSDYMNGGIFTFDFKKRMLLWIKNQTALTPLNAVGGWNTAFIDGKFFIPMYTGGGPAALSIVNDDSVEIKLIPPPLVVINNSREIFNYFDNTSGFALSRFELDTSKSSYYIHIIFYNNLQVLLGCNGSRSSIVVNASEGDLVIHTLNSVITFHFNTSKGISHKLFICLYKDYMKVGVDRYPVDWFEVNTSSRGKIGFAGNLVSLIVGKYLEEEGFSIIKYKNRLLFGTWSALWISDDGGVTWKELWINGESQGSPIRSMFLYQDAVFFGSKGQGMRNALWKYYNNKIENVTGELSSDYTYQIYTMVENENKLLFAGMPNLHGRCVIGIYDYRDGSLKVFYELPENRSFYVSTLYKYRGIILVLASSSNKSVIIGLDHEGKELFKKYFPNLTFTTSPTFAFYNGSPIIGLNTYINGGQNGSYVAMVIIRSFLSFNIGHALRNMLIPVVLFLLMWIKSKGSRGYLTK